MNVCFRPKNKKEEEAERERNARFMSGPTWHSPQCTHTPFLIGSHGESPGQTNSAETSYRGYLLHQWKTDPKQIVVFNHLSVKSSRVYFTHIMYDYIHVLNVGKSKLKGGFF